MFALTQMTVRIPQPPPVSPAFSKVREWCPHQASSPPLSSLSSVWYCPGFSVLPLRSRLVERRHLPHMKLSSWMGKQPPAEHPGSALLFTQQVPNIFCQKEAVSLWSVLLKKKESGFWLTCFLGRILFLLEPGECESWGQTPSKLCKLKWAMEGDRADSFSWPLWFYKGFV